jgi:hypothetical protein
MRRPTSCFSHLRSHASTLALSLASLFLLAYSLPLNAQRGSTSADTTIEEQTRNNTSASNDFRGTQNGNPPPAHVSKEPLRSLLYAQANTKIYARVVPFFLNSQKHINVGYSSDDPREVRRQVEDMMSRGIDGAIIDWYGRDHPDLGRASVEFRNAAEDHPGFTFVISEDKGALKNCVRNPNCEVTGHLIEDLNYAYDHFEKSSSYLQRDGRPVVFFFDVNLDNVDWSRVRKFVKGNPLFIFRNKGAFSMPQSDGAFSWVDHTGRREMPYLDDFYKKYFDESRSRPLMAVASVYKGFDDRAASWSEGRVTDQECGQIWLDTFAKVNRYFSPSKPLDALEVVTWNDYEEGTEIETGIDGCVQIQPSLSGRKLTWHISGNENTINHFVVYASPDGQKLIKLAQLPRKARDWEVRASDLAAGRYQLFVQAVGEPSIIDKLSAPVPWEETGRR